MELPKGWIFDIKKFAVHDGPGIRTTVFLKGCPLRCWWCHNPEAISSRPELVFFANKCIGCGECFKVCQRGGHEILDSGERVYHRERCVLCGECVEYCYAEALVMEGKEVSVEDVMIELRKDIPFYENSDGGITISGGEPLFQIEFTLALLRQCKAEHLHTAIDTSGQASWANYEKILPFVDLVLYDMKHIDPERHREYTGVRNDLILENLRKMSQYGVPIEIRMPIIPTLNDYRESIEGIATFLRPLENITRLQLLPYHRLGEAKYERLERDNRMPSIEPPSKEQMQQIATWIQPYGLEVNVNG